jgi:hypothetical protein
MSTQQRFCDRLNLPPGNICLPINHIQLRELHRDCWQPEWIETGNASDNEQRHLLHGSFIRLAYAPAMSTYEIVRTGVRYELIERTPNGACPIVTFFRSLRQARSYMFGRIATLTNDELDELLARDEPWSDC